MFRNNLWHFHMHKLKVPVSIPQCIHKCPFTAGSFSVLLPFHSNRLKGALKVIFMAPGQVQKANVKTEADCWKRSLLLSSADTGTNEQVTYQWKKKKPWAKSACCIFSFVSCAGWRSALLLAGGGVMGRGVVCEEEERRFALAERTFFFFFLNRIKLGGTGRHTCIYGRKACWLLKFRASFWWLIHLNGNSTLGGVIRSESTAVTMGAAVSEPPKNDGLCGCWALLRLFQSCTVARWLLVLDGPHPHVHTSVESLHLWEALFDHKDAH